MCVIVIMAIIALYRIERIYFLRGLSCFILGVYIGISIVNKEFFKNLDRDYDQWRSQKSVLRRYKISILIAFHNT